MKILTALSIASVLGLMTACAGPATQVKVPTMSMQQAWNSTPTAGPDANAHANGRVVNAIIRQDQPLPVVSAPDIRMGYYYQAPDQEGNMHYGHWVAIPVDSFKWISPEGESVPLTGAKAVQGGERR